jgi:O-acetyl-ADP-ribose deacetylase (regulator of RNase III)/NAD-dependent SIR2 family protein deacetylase
MTKLQATLRFLLNEAEISSDRPDIQFQHQHRHHLRTLRNRLDNLETYSGLRLLKQLLCIRHTVPRLPESILTDIDEIIQQQRSHRILTSAKSIQAVAFFPRRCLDDGRVIVWQGDITTLSNITAITNAANAQGLGCFQPAHRCIDNIIHSWAGPRLRDDCYDLMERRGCELSPGDAIVTSGHCLPAKYVIHTVGPQMARGTAPKKWEAEQLAKCYRSVLDSAEQLPADDDGEKIVAFCGISTGLFAFPAQEAAAIAINTVYTWFREHMESTITRVIFNTFTDADHQIYLKSLESPPGVWVAWNSRIPRPPLIQCESLELVRQWLHDSDAVIVSAGAGLSASDGLDYTSTTLFARHFPGFLKYGLRRLYDVFGFSEWPSEQDRWGYYFTHLAMVRSWPESSMYKTLIAWLEKFGPDAHVRTSNADGLFVANGWCPEKLSTPQGSYSVLQCLANCRPESTVPSTPLVLDAQPYLDPKSQRLTNSSKVPRCEYCGSKMNICVRAADWFNELPFEEGETRWSEFRQRVRREQKKIVILELGVGVSTPGVLRWPNEHLVMSGAGRVKLIRIGRGIETAVSSQLEETGLATSIDGDIGSVIQSLFAAEE